VLEVLSAWLAIHRLYTLLLVAFSFALRNDSVDRKNENTFNTDVCEGVSVCVSFINVNFNNKSWQKICCL